MINKLKNLLIIGLLLAGVSSYSQDTTEELIHKHLNVNGIVFNEPVSASLLGRYPPNKRNELRGRDFESFSFRLNNGKVCKLNKTYAFPSAKSARYQLERLKPLYTKLLSGYSGVPLGDIKWVEKNTNLNEDEGEISIYAEAKNFSATLTIAKFLKYMLGASFEKK